MVPGVLFTGGPATQFPGLISRLTGNEGEHNRGDALRAFSDLMPLFNLVRDDFSSTGYSLEFTPNDPKAMWLLFSYAANDWIQAFTDWNIENGMQQAGRALGIPVKRD